MLALRQHLFLLRTSHMALPNRLMLCPISELQDEDTTFDFLPFLSFFSVVLCGMKPPFLKLLEHKNADPCGLLQLLTKKSSFCGEKCCTGEKGMLLLPFPQ